MGPILAPMQVSAGQPHDHQLNLFLFLLKLAFIRLLNPTCVPNPMASPKDASVLSTYGSTTAPTPQSSFAETMAPYVAEFIGTYLLVFAIAICGIAESVDFGGTATGSLLAVLVYSLGPVSGGHFNPAVSFACGLTRKMPWAQVIAYILLQVSAGVVAGIACYEIFQRPLGVSPIPPFGFWDAAFLEALYTGMLCFVVLCVSTSKSNNPDRDQNHYFGLAIGLVIVAGGQASGGISGGVFNPAVSLGLEVVGARQLARKDSAKMLLSRTQNRVDCQ